ncbi:MAG: glycosyltransferase family 4 protein [Anaerolineaceae bacterium]|jgi:sugar transferase (PEP-CTERM/EpsH1 system associated)|nr:glycosyltransferase family 4 protein [Anaerolineaceae bacterium]
MRFLMITNTLPYPPIAGLPIRNIHLLQRIARHHNVWLLVMVAENERNADLGPLADFCEEVILVPTDDPGALARPMQALKFLLAGTPPELRLYETKEMISALRDLTSRVDFDIIQFEDSFMAHYQEYLPADWSGKKVLTFIDIAYRQYDRIYRIESKLARKLRLWLYSRMMYIWEPRYAGHFDLNVTMSDMDRDLLLSRNSHLHIKTVPNGVDTREFQPLPMPAEHSKKLIYVGNMGYRPNVDAVTFFCEDILPLIRAEVPDVEFWIVGNSPPPEVETLANDHVHVTGRVEDVRPYYQDSTVCVIPLRAGGGTRLKILESMALGRPVVSTSIGAEGIDITDGENILLGDDPHTFANQTILLLQDKGKRQTIRDQARQFVVDHYDWDSITTRLLKAFEELN